MIEYLVSLPFEILEIPNLRIRKPSWVQMPSAMAVFSLVLLSYFLVTGGIIYDVIIEPPSIGSTTDESGHTRPVAILPYRVNGQYIMEGLASSFLFTIGGIGIIVLERSSSHHKLALNKLNTMLLFLVGVTCISVSYITCNIFMKMKLPGYLLNR